MSDPPRGAPPPSESPPMTPERWQAVNAILEGALACDPAGRDAFVAEACAGDAALHREITSLLAVHDRTGDDFLERPAAEALGVVLTPASLTERLASALEGRYVIERELARGGMATVFVARDVRHDRRVAIKVLRDELAAAVGTERFLEEIRVTASLQHPHILPLFDSGSGNGLLWYVMPFVEGETLRARLQRERRLPVAEAVRLTREMADALEHAHRQGVVHRDVKPENVLIQDGHVLVADFGIALALEHAGGERLTRTGLTLGTPQYMAPEQATGTRTIDARTDVYALGTVLYEMLAGQAPFAASSQAAVLWRTRNEPATALGMTRRDVSSILDAAVQRALAKRPEDRFASAAEFATALGAAAGTATASSGSAPGDTRGAPETEPSHERRVSARAAMYAAAAMLVIGLVAGWMLARSSLPSQVASRSRDAANLITTGANPGTPTPAGDLALTVVDRTGQSVRSIPADRPWTPRFSPDGRRVAYGAFGAGRGTSDLWVTDLATGATDRLTDNDADSNDPQWGPKGATLAFSVSAPRGKDLQVRDMTTGDTRSLATRDGTQFPSDWLRDGSALLVTEEAGGNRHDILVQPADGSPATPYAPSQADETAARISPDGRWVAYTSDASGRPEVYLDAYPTPGQRVLVSSGGGVHPVWRGDGRELYYWHDGALVAVRIGAATGTVRPDIGTHTELFRAPYEVGVNTMYDVSPDGQRFIIVLHRE